MPNDRPTGVATHREELALLADAVVDYAIFILSPTGEVQTWNRGAIRIFGYEPDGVIGSHFSRFYPDRDRDEKPARELEIAGSEGRVEDEGWRLRKDGSRFWANTVITALRGADGEMRGFAKVTRDLTARRAAEEDLRRSEEMFRLLVENVQDYAIFMLDVDGRVVSWNAGAQRIKQYRPDEIIGKHFSTFYPPEDIADGKPERELADAVRVGRVEDEGWRLRKDGTRFWATVVITAVFDEKGVHRGFAKVTRDATKAREAEQTRRALLEQREARLQAEEEKRHAESSYRSAQESSRAKDEFLMTLSHELRTPMTSILGWSRILPTLSPADPTFREAVAAIGRSAQLQAQLIDDVLDVSRIVSGKLRLSVETVDVAKVLKNAVENVRPTANAKQITLTTSFTSDLGSATVDPMRLQQIVWNLLSNAVKFTPKKGTVELAAERTASQVQIMVTDSGEGIDPRFLPHVFEPFRQAESTATRVHGGLGLGLSIVRYLSEAHGGSVSAESDGRGKGARFIVTLPIRAIQTPSSRRAPDRDEEAVHTPQFANLTGWRVLVVDDDHDGRELVAAALRHAGAEVAAVDSGAAALDHVAEHPIDVVLTDIAMPQMDGFTLQRLLRERDDFRDIPIVALTAFPPSVMSIDEKEFTIYLRKPIDPFELTERLKELLDPAS
jgi:PAS domain S-box-containing protein